MEDFRPNNSTVDRAPHLAHKAPATRHIYLSKVVKRMAGGAKLVFMFSPFSSTSNGSAWMPGYLIVGMAGPEPLRAAPKTTAAEARFSPTPGPGVRASHTVAAAAAAAAVDSSFSQTPSLA